jgi:hypothetical protein
MSVVDALRRGRVNQADSAAELLGPDHPLVRTLSRRSTPSEQGAVLAGVLTVAAGGLFAGVSGALAVLVAAAVVTAGVSCTRVALRATEHDRLIDLIVTGHGNVALPALERERARLVHPEHCLHLAGWLDTVRKEAEDPRRLIGAARPLYTGRVVAAAGPELTDVAARLRESDVNVRGVAMAECLLCHGWSPLYGPDAEDLRSELRRIRLTLQG